MDTPVPVRPLKLGKVVHNGYPKSVQLSVVSKSAAVATTIEEDIAVTDRYKLCLNIMYDTGGHW